jgi:hypothetical protein
LAGLRRKNGNRVTARFYDAATILFADFEGFTKLAESMEPKELIRDMNPSVSRSFIDAHMADDPARAQAEYLAQFRTDVERFIPPEIVEACVGDFRERSPMTGLVYSGFVELAVVENFAALLKTYRISKVLGDHYGGEFVKEPFRKQGINYEVCKTPKSDLFRDLLPVLNSRHITLPQHNRLIAQIVGLERRVSRAGKDSIAHAPQGQDDLVNAVAGCAAALHKKFYDPFMGCGDDDDPDGSRAWQRQRKGVGGGHDPDAGRVEGAISSRDRQQSGSRRTVRCAGPSWERASARRRVEQSIHRRARDVSRWQVQGSGRRCGGRVQQAADGQYL